MNQSAAAHSANCFAHTVIIHNHKNDIVCSRATMLHLSGSWVFGRLCILSILKTVLITASSSLWLSLLSAFTLALVIASFFLVLLLFHYFICTVKQLLTVSRNWTMLLPQLCDLKYVTSGMGRRRGRRIPRFRSPVGSRGLLGQLAITFPGPNITITRARPCGPALAEYNCHVGQLRLEQLHQNLQPQNHLVVSQRGAMISDRISSPSVVFRAARKYARRKANVSFRFMSMNSTTSRSR